MSSPIEPTDWGARTHLRAVTRSRARSGGENMPRARSLILISSPPPPSSTSGASGSATHRDARGRTDVASLSCRRCRRRRRQYVGFVMKRRPRQRKFRWNQLAGSKESNGWRPTKSNGWRAQFDWILRAKLSSCCRKPRQAAAAAIIFASGPKNTPQLCLAASGRVFFVVCPASAPAAARNHFNAGEGR